MKLDTTKENKMRNSIVSISVLIILSLACTNTPAIANTPAPKAPQQLDSNVEMIVTAEIGVQVRSACGVNNPTTGIILTHGEKVTPMGAAVVLPDMSRWQPITQGCVNADYLGIK